MPRRIISSASECIICLSIDERNLSTMTTAFIRGYIAGMHKFAKGESANECLCETHALDIDEARAFYVGSGILFPGKTPKLPTSTRVDVTDGEEPPSASVWASRVAGARRHGSL